MKQEIKIPIKVEYIPEVCCESCNEVIGNEFTCPACNEAHHIISHCPNLEDDENKIIECGGCHAKFEILNVDTMWEEIVLLRIE